MGITRTLLRVLVALALGLLPTLGHAASITIGTLPATPPDKNCIPFNCTLAPTPGSTRYQQIYDGSIFPSFITITEISFFNHLVNGASLPAKIQAAFYEISLSTSSQSVAGFNTPPTDFVANLGPDNTLFFSGLRNDQVPGGQKFTILPNTGGQPFLYDPSLGNLLLDVKKTITGELGFGGLSTTVSLPDTSAMHNFGGTFTSGLITEFSYQSQTPAAEMPEPGTMFLLGSGLLGLGAWRWKSRRLKGDTLCP